MTTHDMGLYDVATELTERFRHGDLAHEIAPMLSCSELDALTDLFRQVGADQAADVWLAEHAPHDDRGDRHYLGDTDTTTTDAAADTTDDDAPF